MHVEAVATHASAVPMPAASQRLDASAQEAVIEPRMEEGVRCGRGILLMIGVEAVAALGVYGIWQAVHLFR
jgi:hypothetical protein